MSNFLRTISNCCAPCTDPQTVNIPGASGADGAAGAAGADGINAFTTVTDITGPLMPAIGANVTIEVGSTLWMVGDTAVAEGMVVVIGPPTGAFMGYMLVVNVVDATNVELENLGYADNAAPGTPFAPGMKMSPAGPQGLSAAGAGVSDSQAITSGVSSQAIAAPAGNFGFVPTVIIATVHKPSGGMNIFPSVHTVAATGFTADFSGTIPATGYFIEYLALP